jgi:hypothetical protein
MIGFDPKKRMSKQIKQRKRHLSLCAICALDQRPQIIQSVQLNKPAEPGPRTSQKIQFYFHGVIN